MASPCADAAASREPLLAATAPEPLFSVIIVNYRQWEETGALVRQLCQSFCVRQGGAEIIVIDNRSARHRLAGRLRRLPGVSLRRWRRNRGFARAVNEGCRLSRGTWIVLLNPDVTVPDGFLDELSLLAERLSTSEPKTGVIGLELRNPDSSRQLSAGPPPTVTRTIAGLLLPRTRRKYHRPPSGRREVSWVTGCGLLLRRECFDAVGGFDERFFLYYEDADFCRRAKELGWSVWYEPALHLTHHRPLQSRAVPPHLRACTRLALLTYAGKHWSPWQARLMHRLVALEARMRRGWARWRGQVENVRTFSVLLELVKDSWRGDHSAAHRRLERLLREKERHRGAAPVHRHSQPQPGRSPPRLPDRGLPARPR